MFLDIMSDELDFRIPNFPGDWGDRRDPIPFRINIVTIVIASLWQVYVTSVHWHFE